MLSGFGIIIAFIVGCLSMFFLSEFYNRKIREAEDAVRRRNAKYRSAVKDDEP